MWLKHYGLKPLFEIIDECQESEWERMERAYIKLYKSLGAHLLNQLPGGEGGPTMLGRKLTPEQCAKISASKIGKKRPGLNNKDKGIKIAQFDLSGNSIAEHGSVLTAARAIGRNSKRILCMIHGERPNGRNINHVGGFVFKKVE